MWKKRLLGSSMCRVCWSWKAILIVSVGMDFVLLNTFQLFWKSLTHQKAPLTERAAWLYQPAALEPSHILVTSCSLPLATVVLPRWVLPERIAFSRQSHLALGYEAPIQWLRDKGLPWDQATARLFAWLSSIHLLKFLKGFSLNTHS